ncbi:hypothetical protein [Glycomyces arizonensis]|uniref:hypothetical protein n=1 Tax=Glycomyces arizonensis TaxID=256035 RepID=UPI000416F57A|nr:hypothetical protein [Glycomyces arizonensis]
MTTEERAPAAKHGFHAADDVDNAPEFAYRDEAGRRYQADPNLVFEFDSVADYKAGRSTEAHAREGLGLLDVFVCTDAAAAATGVLLLDDRPVAAGDGRYQIEVAPGRHRIEVQGADASSGEFTVAPGERVCYTTGQGVSVRHQPGYRTHLYRARDGSDHLPVLTGAAANAGNLGCLSAVAGLVLIVASAVWMFLVQEGVMVVIAGVLVFLGLAMLVGGMIVGFGTTSRLHRRVRAARVEPVHRSAGSALAFPAPEDLRLSRKGTDTTGAAIMFDLFFYRLTRRPDGTAVYSGRQEALALAHAARPRLWIDGAEAPCDWATWFYPLSPGEHRFSVEYGPDPFGGATVRHEFAFAVADRGDVAVLHVPVRVFRVWDERSQRLTGLPPQLGHRVSKRSLTAVARADGQDGIGEAWTPSRVWVD